MRSVHVLQATLVCKPGWLPFCNSCYTLVKSMMMWSQAQLHCQSLEGHLVSVTSAQENDFVVKIMGKERNVWIGAHGSGDTFEWDGGDPWGFSGFPASWAAPRSRECVQLTNDGLWRTYRCNFTPIFICEVEVNIHQIHNTFCKIC